MTLDPRRTVFVLLSFEGPDPYSQAGGLGVRIKGLSRTLAEAGYLTYLYFCGDPGLPGAEGQEGERLQLRRWSQWISAQHPGGVYDGEEGKVQDWNHSLPPSLVASVIEPLIAEGKVVVILSEEWHTSWSVNLISEALIHRGLRDRVVMLWNANNTYGFNRIDWRGLSRSTTITTVSHYMKFRMWDWGVNPIVIPNGIPREAIVEPDPRCIAEIRAAAGGDHLWFKIGRFDPDKRWLMAVGAAGMMKRRGKSLKFLIRGGREPHGLEVIARARLEGLTVKESPAPADVAGLVRLLRDAGDADVVNLTTFVSDPVVRAIYGACDAVLANSGHEPFGLVGLETMAAGGLAVTGSTGEDYAEAYRNAIVLETDDPLEIVTELSALKENPGLATRIRSGGKATAKDYVWENVLPQLLSRVELAAQLQAVKPAAERSLEKP